MNLQPENLRESCPREEIIAYLDCELSSQEEAALDLHLIDCKVCTDELNAQKNVSISLEIVLEEEAETLELPEDFTKVITTKAESSVCGLRHPQERSRALIICAILFLLVTIALGTEANAVVLAVDRFANQFAAVSGFVFHLIYDAAIGIAVILRGLSHRFIFGSVFGYILALCVFAFTSFSLSRIVLRRTRT